MAGRYGMSFAKKHIEEGDYEEAIAAATKSIDGGDAGPEPLFDRATAYDLVERYPEAVTDFEAAIAKNSVEQEIDPFTLDDAYFSARSRPRARRRRATSPRASRSSSVTADCTDGEHLAESRDWQKRLKGEMPTLLDKTKDIDAV